MKHYSLLAAVMLLSACDDRHATTREVYVDSTGNEVVAQPGQTIVHDDNGNALMNGIIIGHLLSNSVGGYSSGSHYSSGYSGSRYSGKRTKKTTVINNHTTVIHAASARPSYRPSTRSSYSSPSRSTYRPSATRSSSSFSSRATRRR